MKKVFIILSALILCSCGRRVDEELPGITETAALPAEETVATAAPESVTDTALSETSPASDTEETTSETTEQLILTTAVSEEEYAVTERFEREFIDISKFREYDKGDLFHFGVTPVYKINEDTYSIRYALMNEKGEIVSGFDYEQICGFSPEGVAAFLEKGKWGFCDVNGNVLLEPVYADVGIDLDELCCTVFDEGMLSVADNTDNWGFINTDLEEVIPLKYTRPFDDRAPRFVNGLALVRNDNSFYAYIDKTGREICAFKYTYAEDMNENGYAIVGTGEEDAIRYGIIDSRGREIVPCEFDIVTDFSDEGRCIAANYPDNPQKPLSDYRLYSGDGSFEEISLGWRSALNITPPPERTEYEKALYRANFMPYVRNSYFGIRNLKGNNVTEAIYENIYDIDKSKLPEGTAVILERFGKRYTFMQSGENIQYTERRMDDTDPEQQILLELAGFRPEYRTSVRTGEKVLSAVYKGDVLYADLSALETPKATVSADGYLYVLGYKENPDGGYSTIRRLISPDGEEVELPEHCTPEYRYIWGGY